MEKSVKTYVLVIMPVKLTVHIPEKSCFRSRQKVFTGQHSCLAFKLFSEWAFLVDIAIDQFFFFKRQNMDSSSI